MGVSLKNAGFSVYSRENPKRTAGWLRWGYPYDLGNPKKVAWKKNMIGNPTMVIYHISYWYGFAKIHMIRKPPFSYRSMMYECGKPIFFTILPSPVSKKNITQSWELFMALGLTHDWSLPNVASWEIPELNGDLQRGKSMEKPHAPRAPWHRRVYIVYIHITNTCWGYGGFCRVSQWMRTSYTTN